ncbi:ATP-dependent RNA helicase YejH [Nitrincola lacisaponensis]|uniref:ATP-dependent RNA helicase YejH n=1 Tax=Nitrincola lacisaponensis TaxID=267850 RepID=A0A063Y860_9GAMM|nr:DEAD/DEAH box helicase [Nitrincola lacisaponensis]KDE41305.1 ATP-dependent RNA helicase YejH [Nitrincola lacisaponensis]
MSTIRLRNYQQQAVAATLNHFRHSNESALIVLPTGAGKSLVIAELARLARHRLLVLTHVQELVEQNHAKYTALGMQAGLFSTGLGKHQTDYAVTFASIQSLASQTERFTQPFSLVIIDECHRVSLDENSQYQQVLQHLRHYNPSLKLLGLTATPYRLGQGWIYRRDYRGFVRETDQAIFEHCIYELPLSHLIREGYLTPPVCQDAAVHHYDFSRLEHPDDSSQAAAVNQLLRKYPRVTQAICEEVMTLAQTRRGIMLFAASVEHAEEILGYLPGTEAGLITGKTESQLRADTIQAFKQQKLRYLVNVSVLTTGFDAPHVDLIAILRPTRSISLYQQMAGRGLRLYPGKQDCLIIDYAANGFNLFTPEVGSPKPAADTEPVQVFCPDCGFANTFWGRTDDQGQVTEHFGRRCQGLVEQATQTEQCRYRFRFKECPACQHENDIAARRCEHCNKTLIDPDDLLKRALSLKDARILRCAGVTCEVDAHKLTLIYHDEEGDTLKESFDFTRPGQRQRFNQDFGRRLSPTPRCFTHAQEVLLYAGHLRHPDFVIARRQKHYWRIEEKLFDYQGRYRKAYELH